MSSQIMKPWFERRWRRTANIWSYCWRKINAAIGKYASENGVASAVKKFNDKSLHVSFPSDWHITYTVNHWANKITYNYLLQKYYNSIYEERKKSTQAWRWPLCTSTIWRFQRAVHLTSPNVNNFLFALISNNCTDRLQPSDLSVNKPTKDFIRDRFQDW